MSRVTAAFQTREFLFSTPCLQFINIDDCWQVDRTPDGTIVPDPVRFPSGMKALADYIHSKVSSPHMTLFLLVKAPPYSWHLPNLNPAHVSDEGVN